MNLKHFLKTNAVAITVLGMAVSTSAFISLNKTTAEYWVYTSTDASGFTSASKYQKITLDPEDNEVCSPGSNKPCVFKEVESTIDDQTELQNYLNSAYTQSTQAAKDIALLGDAVSKKN